MAEFMIKDRFVVQVDILAGGIGGVNRQTCDNVRIRGTGVPSKHNIEIISWISA